MENALQKKKPHKNQIKKTSKNQSLRSTSGRRPTALDRLELGFELHWNAPLWLSVVQLQSSEPETLVVLVFLLKLLKGRISSTVVWVFITVGHKQTLHHPLWPVSLFIKRRSHVFHRSLCSSKTLTVLLFQSANILKKTKQRPKTSRYLSRTAFSRLHLF